MLPAVRLSSFRKFPLIKKSSRQTLSAGYSGEESFSAPVSFCSVASCCHCAQEVFLYRGFSAFHTHWARFGRVCLLCTRRRSSRWASCCCSLLLSSVSRYRLWCLHWQSIAAVT